MNTVISPSTFDFVMVMIMSEHLKKARDEIEMVRLLRENLPYESQPRGKMEERLNLAKTHIDIELDGMERTEKINGGDR